jgi:hypothetical protein
MAQGPSTETTLPDFFDRLETLFPDSEPAAPEDLSLCFICLRWLAGGCDFRPGPDCEVRLAMEAPTPRTHLAPA